MNLTLFEHILFKSLRPWIKNEYTDRDFTNFLKTPNFISQPKSIDDFKDAVNSIFLSNKFTKDEDFELYNFSNDSERFKINEPLVLIELPKAKNPKCRFYNYLISNEVTRLMDLLYRFHLGATTNIEKKYVINNLSEKLKHLIKEATKSLDLIENNEDSTYIISILRLSLVRFLLEIENVFISYLNTPITTDEELYFDLLNDEIPEQSIYEFSNLLNLITSSFDISETDDFSNSNKLSFNFNGNKVRLLNVITQLNSQIELLNDDVTTPQGLFDVLTAKDLLQPLPKILFNTETTQVRYVFDKLSPSFSNLTMALIVKTELFYSKSNKEPLTKSNLSSSKISHPKNKDIIDEIFRSL